MVSGSKRQGKQHRKRHLGLSEHTGRLRRLLRLSRARKRRLTVTSRFEAGMMLSELLTGLLFITGSILMFYPGTKRFSTVLYLLGSIMMLLRSGIRGSYWFRLKSLEHSSDTESSSDQDWSR